MFPLLQIQTSLVNQLFLQVHLGLKTVNVPTTYPPYGHICFKLTFVLPQRDGTHLFNFVSEYRSWADYLRSMASDGTWGDHIILHAAADYFNTCILVISSRWRDVTINPKGDLGRRNLLVLGHIHEGHYVSLRPTEPGKNSLHAVKKSSQIQLQQWLLKCWREPSYPAFLLVISSYDDKLD